MPATLRIFVADPTGISQDFDRILVYSSATEDGTFDEVTTAGTRPVIRAGETRYDFTDPAGDATTWYRTSYYNSVTSLESEPSDAQQIAALPLPPVIEPAPGPLDVISPAELRDIYLFGVDLTDDAGNSMSDNLLAHYIRAAVARAEATLDLAIAPVTVTAERHSFVPQDYYNAWNRINLYKKPVRSITQMQLILPPETVTVTYDNTWIKLNQLKGQIRLVPGSGQLIITGTSWFAPFLSFSAGQVPNLFSVSYEAGFERGQCPADIKHFVGLIASFGPLNIAGDLVFGAGLAMEKVGLDGLMTEVKTTQSSTNAGYGARLNMYRKEIADLEPALIAKYKGVLTTAV